MDSTDRSFRVPDELSTGEFVLRPIRESDAELDHEAVMSSKEFLRDWEQTGWPKEDFTVEANREDLVRLRRRHENGESFTYTVLNPQGDSCLGCVYVVPTSAELFAKAEVRPTGDSRWSEFEIAVYFWVRESRTTDGLDARLLDAMDPWFRRQWNVRYLLLTNERVSHQVDLLESTGCTLRFELAYSSKPGKELAYSMHSTQEG
ncbi:MAG: N-acetyltransferase [Candidatus Eisenbacteria bacterium]|uniref:N-acetyltransferase n=1 Tax=Eiseniibacteriota bacterium TaxID=2212470 RepID=A0A956M354_UNCEI|nr:N-acetyltransferase [Candidatus Eisenbacteria bacterium]MCA9753434.1 N-acetyltransferase [Gemmatimonadota bacterium]